MITSVTIGISLIGCVLAITSFFKSQYKSKELALLENQVQLLNQRVVVLEKARDKDSCLVETINEMRVDLAELVKDIEGLRNELLYRTEPHN